VRSQKFPLIQSHNIPCTVGTGFQLKLHCTCVSIQQQKFNKEFWEELNHLLSFDMTQSALKMKKLREDTQPQTAR
jgi:hypothetical protein